MNGGADVHALNKWRETPLLTAANHGQSGAVDALLQNGADPCKCTDTGWSPLSIAAYKGHDEVVRLLLEEGAPTEEDDPTLSALLQAATKGLSGTVELLLRHGADHTVTTKKGDTALSILVEQNLIDAAVEMVTGYNASIPRCSRDRKKVQRARLLINLRMKQLEREGRNAGEGSTDEEETDEEQDSSKQAQHCQDDMTEFSAAAPVSKSAKKRKKKKSNRVSAEEKARAAEEALLLELEQEESKAEKHKANANSKRKKKKERKAKEREQKLKEENARREQQEQENRERVRIRKEKEDQERKERELQLRHAREQQEREKKKKMEQEVFLAAEHKEREKERQKREQRVKLTAEQAVDDSTSNGFHGKVDKASTSTRQRPTSIRSGKGNGASPSPKIAQPVTTGNRRWETTKKTKSPSRAVALLTHTNPLEHTPASNTTLKSVLTPRSVWKSEQPHFSPPPPGDTNPSANKADPIVTSLEDTSTCSPLASEEVEHPAIALFRRDKVAELLARCSQALAMPDDTMLKRIFYRWSVRATHDSSPTLDSVIPSWTDTHRVVAFFQRQLIAESRRTSSLSASMEALKETGSLIAMYCQSIAAEVDNFRCRIEKHLPKDWTDSALGMTATNGPMGRNGAMVTVSWANRAQVFISAETFGALRERHVGAPSRFLAACFMAKLWYDTRRLILGGTTMDFRLSPRSKQCLSVVAGVSAELWSDPFNSENGNVFWGTSESVDSLFGGQKPFGKDQLGGEEVLAKHGGSLSVLLPMDANVASSYVQRMTDILKKTQRTNVPVTFFVVAHADCFHDLPTGLSLDDLRRLDPRLADGCQGFVSCSQLLQGGNHTFGQGDEMGVEVICNTTSLFVVLQNDAGRTDVDTSQSTIANIIGSLSFQSQVEDPMVTSLGISNDSNGTPLATHGSYFESLPPISPDPHRIVRAEIGAIGGAPLSHPFSPSSDSVSRVSRNRGRLFDLVDNGEEDDVDLVSGMLNNLDVGLFQNNNVGSDVDIEAISLMGIGGPPHSVKSGRSHQGGFS